MRVITRSYRREREVIGEKERELKLVVGFMTETDSGITRGYGDYNEKL